MSRPVRALRAGFFFAPSARAGWKRGLVSLAIGAALGWPELARADGTAEQKAAATVLFREGKAMMEKGDIPGACRHFEESHRLDPLPGTLLNLAVCHEREGRTATAWVEFRDAGALARRDARDDRVALAEEHMKALEPRLSTVRIVVRPLADVPSLSVTLDGTVLARPAWDNALPVDPGLHVIGASAPAKTAFSARVEVTREGEARTIVVDALVDAPVAAPVVAATLPPPAVSAPKEVTGLSTRRLSALVLGGAGIVSAGVGAYFGVDAIAKHADSNRACPAGRCTQDGVTANDESKVSADRSTVLFAVALPALAIATYLWVSGGNPSPASPTAIRVVPAFGRDGGGISLARVF